MFDSMSESELKEYTLTFLYSLIHKCGESSFVYEIINRLENDVWDSVCSLIWVKDVLPKSLCDKIDVILDARS